MKKLFLSFLMATAPLALTALAALTTVCAYEPGGNLTLGSGEHVASGCIFTGQTTIAITANATSFSIKGGTVEGGLLNFQLSPSIWHVTIEVRGVSFGKVSGGGAILLSGVSLKPIVNSKINIADCTFRNIVAPGLPGEGTSITMSSDMTASDMTIANNSFYAEMNTSLYAEMFMATSRCHRSNITVADNTADFMMVSKGAFGSLWVHI